MLEEHLLYYELKRKVSLNKKDTNYKLGAENYFVNEVYALCLPHKEDFIYKMCVYVCIN